MSTPAGLDKIQTLISKLAALGQSPPVRPLQNQGQRVSRRIQTHIRATGGREQVRVQDTLTGATVRISGRRAAQYSAAAQRELARSSSQMAREIRDEIARSLK